MGGGFRALRVGTKKEFNVSNLAIVYKNTCK